MEKDSLLAQKNLVYYAKKDAGLLSRSREAGKAAAAKSGEKRGPGAFSPKRPGCLRAYAGGAGRFLFFPPRRREKQRMNFLKGGAAGVHREEPGAG